MDEIEIKLPHHAIRYLRSMCASERRMLSETAMESFGLGIVSAFDSLNAIENALPKEEQ